MRVTFVKGSYGGVGFRALYSVEDAACGGELTSSEGRIASPGFPENYPDGAECVWTVDSAPGNRVGLNFISLDIEESANCNKDYVEVHKDGPHGPLEGRFCGQNIPSNLTAADRLWIKFNSDRENTGTGFVAQFNLRMLYHLILFLFNERQNSIFSSRQRVERTFGLHRVADVSPRLHDLRRQSGSIASHRNNLANHRRRE